MLKPEPAERLALPVAPIAHTYTGAGLYTTRLEVSDGRRTAVVTGSVTVGLSEPLTARAGDDRSATVGAAVAFDGAASRPLIGIETYSWDFGDGQFGSGVNVTHDFVFDNPTPAKPVKIFLTTLTVTDNYGSSAAPFVLDITIYADGQARLNAVLAGVALGILVALGPVVRRWLPAGVTTARRACVPTTTRTTTAPSSSTRKATTSKPSATSPADGVHATAAWPMPAPEARRP